MEKQQTMYIHNYTFSFHTFKVAETDAGLLHNARLVTVAIVSVSILQAIKVANPKLGRQNEQDGPIV